MSLAVEFASGSFSYPLLPHCGSFDNALQGPLDAALHPSAGRDPLFSDSSDALRHAIIKLWPPGQPSSTLKRELAYLLLDDPDYRLRMCHVEDLLQTRLPGQSVHGQLQAVLMDPRFSSIFTMEQTSSSDWGWRVLRLDCAELVRQASASASLKVERTPKPVVPETAVLLSIESTWSKCMVDADEYLAVVIAYIIAVKRDLKCQLPPYSLHLTDVGGWLRTFSVNDARLADIFPRCQKRASKRPRISEFLLQAKFRPYFRLRDSAVRKSEKVVSLVVERFLQNLSLRDGRSLLTDEGSPLLVQTGSAPATLLEQLSLTGFTGDDLSKHDMALPNFLFDYESPSEMGEKASEAARERDQSDVFSSLCSAFSLPATLNMSDLVVKEGLLPQFETSSRVPRPVPCTTEESGPTVPKSPFACGAWEADEKGVHSNYCSFNNQEIFIANDSLFPAAEISSVKTEVPKAVASCWGSNSDDTPVDSNLGLTETSSWQSSADASCSIPRPLDSSFISELPSVKSLFADKDLCSQGLFEAPSLQSCMSLDATLQNSLASLSAVLGSGHCQLADMLQSIVTQQEMLQAETSPRDRLSPPPSSGRSSPPSAPDPGLFEGVPGDECLTGIPVHVLAGYAAAAAAARATQEKPTPLLTPTTSFLEAYGSLGLESGCSPKLLPRISPKLRDEIFSLVQLIPGVKLEDFDDGVLYQLSVKKTEEEAIAALRTLQDYDLSSIQHMAAFINHVVKNYQHGGSRQAPSSGTPRSSSTPVSAKAMLQKLPQKVFKKLEASIAACSFLEWKHFDAGVMKVLVQLAELAESDVIEELEMLQTADLSNVEYMPAYLNKRLNNRLWSRRKTRETRESREVVVL